MIIDGYCVLGTDREYDLTASDLLHALDQAEVDRAVIAPVDRSLAVQNRGGNDLMLETAAAHPHRFIPACSVNPWYGKEAVKELGRALAGGARILVLHPAIQGFAADDELTWPLMEVATKERIPVYLHTGPPGSATPWQVVSLADRWTEVDLIMGHCGATDFWNDVTGAATTSANIYLESSFARPFQFIRYLEQVGSEKGIMGSFAPLNSLAFEWEQMRLVVPEELQADVLGGNLLRLLRKRGAL